MTKIIQGVALLALVSASGAERLGHRALRQAGSRRLSSNNFEQLYFFETMANDTTVTVLETGPFKLEATCKTVRYQYSSSRHGFNYSSYEVDDDVDSGYSFSFSSGDDSNSTDDYYYYHYSYSSFYTSDVLALALTYSADTDDYVFGPHEWYDNDPSSNVTQLSGPWTAGETRSADIFRSRDGRYGDSFTLQSLSGHYFSIDAGETAGIHKEYSDMLPGGMAAFPEGLECMTAGIITYHTHNDTHNL